MLLSHALLHNFCPTLYFGALVITKMQYLRLSSGLV